MGYTPPHDKGSAADAQDKCASSIASLELARRVLEIEADAVRALIERIDQDFSTRSS